MKRLSVWGRIQVSLALESGEAVMSREYTDSLKEDRQHGMLMFCGRLGRWRATKLGMSSKVRNITRVASLSDRRMRTSAEIRDGEGRRNAMARMHSSMAA